MDGIAVKIKELLQTPEHYIRPDADLESGWKEQMRQVYNFIKKQESEHNLPAPHDALACLNTDTLDAEQVWQLVELQNEPLLAAGDVMSDLGDANLCLNVAHVSSLTKMGKLDIDTPGDNESLGASEDGDMEDDLGSDDGMDIDGTEKSDDAEDSEEDLLGRHSKDDEGSDSEEMDDENEDDIDNIDIDTNFDNNTDDEVDNFDEFIAAEGFETDDSDDDNKTTRKMKKKQEKTEEDNEADSDASDQEDRTGIRKHKDTEHRQEFKKTSVDTKFFRLRESEWVADNDAIGENFTAGDSDEDIDIWADISDGSEDEEGAMYNAFFDAPPQDEEDSKATGEKRLSQMLDGSDDDDEEEEEDNADDDDDDEEEEEEDNADDAEKKEGDEKMRTENKQEEMQEGKMPLLGAPKKDGKSRFELERERELALMGQLEEENVGEKPWYLKGEAVTAERPEDSALEQNLEYDIAARQKPVITEDTTSLVERIIMGRVRSSAWDDVERRVKPNINPQEYKKALLLDQEKSKKSLAEIYEQEYLKQQDQQELGEEEIWAHKLIKMKMKSLFRKLDALANFHYTPKLPSGDVKIKSNLPAITVEEATPDTATSASLLAPQEVQEPVRGELVGKTERTATDRKRERRTKKAQQKKKTKKREKQLAEKLKKASKTGGKLDTNASVRVIEKAVKAGHVKMLDESQGKAIRSSQAFFKKFQDNRKTTKSGENAGRKKKKKEESNKGQSISKLLL